MEVVVLVSNTSKFSQTDFKMLLKSGIICFSSTRLRILCSAVVYFITVMYTLGRLKYTELSVRQPNVDNLV